MGEGREADWGDGCGRAEEDCGGRKAVTGGWARGA